MNRLLAMLLLLAAGASARAAGPDVWGKTVLTTTREGIEKGDPRYIPAYEALKKYCDEELTKAPYSVMDKQFVPPSGDKHDYVSMGRYWWPDPSKPDGLPYIRRDGHSNPALKQLDRDRMGKMMNAVSKLALAYHYSGEAKYAAKAADLLRVWFLDPETRMNPHMNFGQYILGRNDNKGRAEGLIDTYGMVEMLTGVTYLEDSGKLTEADMNGLRQWFGNYLDWMLTSEQGVAERKTVNNHAIAYDVQIVAYAQFAGRDELAQKTLADFPARRIFTQVMPDGSQPRELARETGFGYSVFNINHMLDMCMLAGDAGAELYGKSSPEGSSIKAAVAYMAQYLGKPRSAFPYKQIKAWESVQESLAWILLRTTLFEPNPTYIEAFDQFDTAPPSYIGHLLLSPQIR